jgi:hypothetical protein
VEEISSIAKKCGLIYILLFHDEPSMHPQANTSGKEFLSVSPEVLTVYTETAFA